MTYGRGDAERRVNEGFGRLVDQFFVRMGVRSLAAIQGATQPRRMPGPVSKLMKTGAVAIDLMQEGRLRRDANVVFGGA